MSLLSTPAGTILRYCMSLVLCVCLLFGLLFSVKSRKGIAQWVLKESTVFRAPAPNPNTLGCKISLSVIFTNGLLATILKRMFSPKHK